jgi:hypothetical protein
MDTVRMVDPTTPRAAAVYLLALRPLLATISGGRRALVRSIKELVEDARRDGPFFKHRALAIGNGRLAFFGEARRQFDAIAPPPSCRDVHRTLGRYLDRLMAASNVMVTVGVTGQLADVRRAQQLLDEAAEFAHQFNEEHERLLELLRALLHDARYRRRMATAA